MFSLESIFDKMKKFITSITKLTSPVAKVYNVKSKFYNLVIISEVCVAEKKSAEKNIESLILLICKKKWFICIYSLSKLSLYIDITDNIKQLAIL